VGAGIQQRLLYCGSEWSLSFGHAGTLTVVVVGGGGRRRRSDNDRRRRRRRIILYDFSYLDCSPSLFLPRLFHGADPCNG